MYVTISATNAELHEPNDASTLFVQATERLAAPQLDASLRAAGFGSFDGTHAYLDISTLRAAVGANLPDAAFDAMIDFANRHDWVTADGRFFTAHLEPTN